MLGFVNKAIEAFVYQRYGDKLWADLLIDLSLSGYEFEAQDTESRHRCVVHQSQAYVHELHETHHRVVLYQCQRVLHSRPSPCPTL